jgi:hypothetical protein
MTTVLNFKPIVDLPKWRPLAQTKSVSLNVRQGFIGSDLRNNEDQHPLIYFMNGNGMFIYNVKTDGWSNFVSSSVPTPFGGGFFMSAQGPRGTITAGATTTSIPLSTLLNNGVAMTIGVNEIANRGDGRGFKIRIIGNSTGSSGKTEERLVIANTGETTTPTIELDSPLSFTPAIGDTYEFLSGRIFVTGGGGEFYYFDILTNIFSLSLSVTNVNLNGRTLFVGLDELLVPYDKNPGEGFFGILTATASVATSITGQAIGGDAGVVAEQYRNFQIRIVEDIANPQAVGQRRNIIGHTAGTSPVYTISTGTTDWIFTPSATAKFVVENNGDRIIAWVNGNSDTNTYTISTDVWDVAGTIFSNRPITFNAGAMAYQAFAIEPDVAISPNARQSFIYTFIGTSTNLLLFDIAGSPTGLWTSNITYNKLLSPYGNTSSIIDPTTNQGRYMYINADIVPNTGPQQFYRFDMKNRKMENFTSLRSTNSFYNYNYVDNQLMAITSYIDGNSKLSFLLFLQPNPNSTLAPIAFSNLFSCPVII